MRELRAWAPEYRRESWRLALADQGIDDPALAEELGEAFAAERRRRHEAHADAAPALEALRATHSLGLLTNGAPCLQREKLAASGLEHYFDVVVVSGDLGVAKPDAAAFRHALDLLGARPADATMIGDSLDRDIEGALAAGLRAVWLNRHGRPGRPGIAEIATLAALSPA
jgi:putative hydrolase of the HAD superfamily